MLMRRLGSVFLCMDFPRSPRHIDGMHPGLGKIKACLLVPPGWIRISGRLTGGIFRFPGRGSVSMLVSRRRNKLYAHTVELNTDRLHARSVASPSGGRTGRGGKTQGLFFCIAPLVPALSLRQRG